MSIRTLRHGELPPTGVDPSRLKNSQGYVRLRWSLGGGEYVECYEHRWVMGNPPADVQVHHINHVRDDNRPENLAVLTPQEHGAEHRTIDREEAIRLYRAGHGTPAIAEVMGLNAAAVYRAIRDASEPMRGASESAALFRIPDDAMPPDAIRRLHEAGVSSRRIASLFGVAASVVDRRVRELGLTPHRPGRQTKDQIARAEAAIREVVG